MIQLWLRRAGAQFPALQATRVLSLVLVLLASTVLSTLAQSTDTHREDDKAHSNSEAEPAWVQAYVNYIQNRVTEDRIPGLALALVTSDEILRVQGFGLRDVAAGDPVTENTLFHVGSTHKSMTALLIAALVDSGHMAWDSPVANVSDKFSLSDPEASARVTIRHLLSMRSGIPDDAESNLPNEATPKDVFEVVAQAPLLGQPGEKFQYSNLSSAISGYLGVLAVGGDYDNLYEEYADLLQSRILNPIGMKTATIYASVAQSNSNLALSYDIDKDGKPVLTPSEDKDGDALAPSGSLKASAAEMALYVRTQLARGLAPNGTRVVSQANVEETWKSYLEEYTMGWERTRHQGMEIIFHTGAFDDFVSVIGFLPAQNVGFVLLINSEKAGNSLIEAAPEVLADMIRRQGSSDIYLPSLYR